MTSDEKIENLLNLALNATPIEMEKSEELDVGFEPETLIWELIIRYTGSLEALRERDIQTVELSNGYAIVYVPEPLIPELSSLPQIEYIEKPKRLFFAANRGRMASCFSALQTPEENLKGQGVIVAVIDSGVDYFHPDFRREDGSTRILNIWDQTIVPANVTVPEMAEIEAGEAGEGEVGEGEAGEGEAGTGAAEAGETEAGETEAGEAGETGEREAGETGAGESEAGEARTGKGGAESESAESRVPYQQRRQNRGRPPEGFFMGVEYTQEEINEALAQRERQAGYAIVPSVDYSGHGTAVLGVAAGNGSSSGGRYAGGAPESDILVVKLGTPGARDFPSTAELMMAVEYVMRKAIFYQKPVAINLSFGNSYGSHTGTSLLESYLDDIAGTWKSVIVAGTGNEGSTRGHADGTLQETTVEQIELAVTEFVPYLNLQIWKNYADRFEIVFIHPNGQSFTLPSRAGVTGQEPSAGTYRYLLGRTQLLIYYGLPKPYSVNQEIYVDFIPVDEYVDSGVWKLELIPERIVSGQYDLWLPGGGILSPGTGFFRPSPVTTLTIPSTSEKVLSVGAYDALRNSYAPFSGRGYTRYPEKIKPELVAPGVDITTTSPQGGYRTVSGTSFAAPFVTAAAALLMQWGIVNGNDAYLYGEKVKAYLQEGARQLPGYTEWPNPQVGWGALCVRDSIPF